ncbi:hypothetical protein Q3G72_024073 [Acer saccharum]|nr:hypothetical protein Q3G72_024073 [Acer saccharum]
MTDVINISEDVMTDEFKYYKAEEETFTSSHEAFRSVFPRGFAWEVLSVYSGPPVIAYKFRHWGFFEGPFKGHAPTGEMVEFYGFGTLKRFGMPTLLGLPLLERHKHFQN